MPQMLSNAQFFSQLEQNTPGPLTAEDKWLLCRQKWTVPVMKNRSLQRQTEPFKGFLFFFSHVHLQAGGLKGTRSSHWTRATQVALPWKPGCRGFLPSGEGPGTSSCFSHVSGKSRAILFPHPLCEAGKPWRNPSLNLLTIIHGLRQQHAWVGVCVTGEGCSEIGEERTGTKARWVGWQQQDWAGPAVARVWSSNRVMHSEVQLLASYTHRVVAPGKSEASWDTAEREKPSQEHGLWANTF